jgi:hypothetical protein
LSSAFPESQAGRLLHHPFRGLLSVHSRYGLQTCQVANATFCTGGFSSFVASTTAPIATGWNEPVPGRDFHPLWISAFSRRTEKLEVSKDLLPAKVYEGASGSRPTIRYFVDKFPLFLASPLPEALPVVTLSFVDSGFETPSGFTGHVHAYLGLFRQLMTFRFLYIAPKDAHFRTAEERFRALVKRPLESDVSSEVLRCFQIRRKWDNREYVVPVTEDFEFLREARQRFHGNRFESLYEAWGTGQLNERDLAREFSQVTQDRTVFFEPYLVKGHLSPLAVHSDAGERCMKDTVHPPVHRSVHPDGERKLVRA